MSWFSKVAQVLDLKNGSNVGYGKKYHLFECIKFTLTVLSVVLRDSKIATLPVGWSDGYPQREITYSSKSKPRVMIDGQTFPVIATPNMNMMMVDVTDAKKKGIDLICCFFL
jgi:alanine racemase